MLESHAILVTVGSPILPNLLNCHMAVKKKSDSLVSGPVSAEPASIPPAIKSVLLAAGVETKELSQSVCGLSLLQVGTEQGAWLLLIGDLLWRG